MRKLLRSMLKHKVGSNKIASAWRHFQTQRYGPEVQSTMIKQGQGRHVSVQFQIILGKAFAFPKLKV